MKTLFIFAILCFNLGAMAQLPTSGSYLYLYSDSIIRANEIIFRRDASNFIRIRFDAQDIPIGTVKFVNNKNGFYASTSKFYPREHPRFAERVIAGKINVFKERSGYDYYHHPRGGSRPGEYYSYADDHRLRDNYSSLINYDPGFPYFMKSMYYNKGMDDIKRINYANLLTDMADNAQSLDLLKSYKRKSTTSKILLAATGAAAVATVITGSRFVNDKPEGPFLAAAGVTMGLAFSFYLTDLSAGRTLKKAFSNYNK